MRTLTLILPTLAFLAIAAIDLRQNGIFPHRTKRP